MLSKKTTLAVAALGVTFTIISLFSREVGICPPEYSSCSSVLDQVAEIFFISVPLLILSIVTFYMHEQIYKSWFAFVRCWIPLSVTFILLVPEYGGHFMNFIAKGNITFVMSLIFIVVSVIIIAYKYFALKPRS